MRSSSPIRFRSASVPRPASLAKMAMPSMPPEEWRSGTPYARISRPEPSSRVLAKVPSQGRPCRTDRASSVILSRSPAAKPMLRMDCPVNRDGSPGTPSSWPA